MEILKPQPTSKAPSDWFTGDVWWDVIYAGQEPSRMRANMVRFAPCARTDWHSHAVGQTLHIVSGTALVQARGGEIVEVHPGETVYTPSGRGTLARRGTRPFHEPPRTVGRTRRRRHRNYMGRQSHR